MTNEEFDKLDKEILTRVKMDTRELERMVAKAINIVESSDESIQSIVTALSMMLELLGYKCKDIRQFYMVCGIVLYQSAEYLDVKLSVLTDEVVELKKKMYENN